MRECVSVREREGFWVVFKGFPDSFCPFGDPMTMRDSERETMQDGYCNLGDGQSGCGYLDIVQLLDLNEEYYL